MPDVKSKLLVAGIALLALFPCICRGAPAKLAVQVISVEQTDISSFKSNTESDKPAKGKPVLPALEEWIKARFYGEIGAYPRFFRIEKKGNAPDLLVRILFSDLHYKDTVKTGSFGKDFTERKYFLSLNITVENPEENVLLCRNLDWEHSLKMRTQEHFTGEDVIFREMMSACLRRAAKLMAEKFTVRYKIVVSGPRGVKDFPADEVKILIDGEEVLNHAITQCVKGKHIVTIDAPVGYASQSFTIDLGKDSKTEIKLSKEE